MTFIYALRLLYWLSADWTVLMAQPVHLLVLLPQGISTARGMSSYLEI
jgi:hypothetical protein